MLSHLETYHHVGDNFYTSLVYVGLLSAMVLHVHRKINRPTARIKLEGVLAWGTMVDSVAGEGDPGRRKNMPERQGLMEKFYYKSGGREKRKVVKRPGRRPRRRREEKRETEAVLSP